MFKRMTVNERVLYLVICVLIGVYAHLMIVNKIGTLTCASYEPSWSVIRWFRAMATSDMSVLSSSSSDCGPSITSAYVIGIVLIACVAGVVLWASHKWAAYVMSPGYLRKTILERKEIAGRREVEREMGVKTAVKRGRQVRPTLQNPTAADVAWQLGTSHNAEVWVSMEDPMEVIGPPRSGKGFTVLTSAIVEAPGAVVTTSSRGDNMEATIQMRSTKGPVFLFDPEGVTGRKNTAHWSPVRGCEDPRIAKKRANVLVSGTGLSEGGNKEWAGKAADVLQCLLHAAAVGQVPLAELHEWTKSSASARRALSILEDESQLGWGPMLEAVLEADPRTRESQWFGVQSSLSAFDIPKVRDIFEITPGQPEFDPEQFLKDSGTLYMVAELRSTNSAPGGVGVFFSMLLDDIVAAAHRISQVSPGGRLDPPCALVLDEIANIHPWPGLPQVMAAGSGEGIQAIPVFQSRSQAREGWGENGERTIWESATRKILLGGSSDATDLRNLMDLMGNREEVMFSGSFEGIEAKSWSEQFRDKPVLSADELRRLPQNTALLVAGRARPMLVDMIPWTDRKWAPHIESSKAWHKQNPTMPGLVERVDTYVGEVKS